MAELALPYVPIDPNIEESERMGLFLDAIDAHDDPMAPWHVVRLLLWAGRHRPDGNLGKLSPRRLASICGWTKDPGELESALTESGWLVEVESGLRVEGWERHGGLVLEQRQEYRDKERLKKQRQRCAKAGHPPESCECPGRVPEMSPGTRGGHDGDRQGTSPVHTGTAPGPSPDVPVMKGEGRRVKGEELLSSSSRPPPLDDDELNAGDVIALAQDWGWGKDPHRRPVSWGKPDNERLAAQLSPFTGEEVEEAKRATEAADGTPNLGLWLAKVQQIRAKPKRKQTAPAAPPKRREPTQEERALLAWGEEHSLAGPYGSEIRDLLDIGCTVEELETTWAQVQREKLTCASWLEMASLTRGLRDKGAA